MKKLRYKSIEQEAEKTNNLVLDIICGRAEEIDTETLASIASIMAYMLIQGKTKEEAMQNESRFKLLVKLEGILNEHL